VASSTDEAITLLRSATFDVLVSDIGMPGEDGYALMRRVRAMEPDKNGDIPAVALTAYARGEDRIKAIRAGFHVHAAKPVDPGELIAAVANLGGLRARG
jgi:CheY-like chemotaxis protein